jgi:hypothetical protein
MQIARERVRAVMASVIADNNAEVKRGPDASRSHERHGGRARALYNDRTSTINWTEQMNPFRPLIPWLLMVNAAGAGPSVPSPESETQCAVSERLAESDAAELRALPAQVARTLAANAGESGLAADPKADEIGRIVAEGRFDNDFDQVKPGRRSCSVYWYGFLDNASERVGSHQCRITRKGGALTVEKLTGDGFIATVFPCKTPGHAVVGRTFLRDQKERGYEAAHPANRGNDNFGNKVGLAYADGGRLFVLSINERGFTEPDETFFEVLTVE